MVSFRCFDDLSVSSVLEMWKYVDDTTVSECIPKGQCSKVQVAVDQVIDWSEKNLFQLNGDKTKELTITYNVGYNLRRERRFAQPLFRTKRFADSFVNRCVSEEMYS